MSKEKKLIGELNESELKDLKSKHPYGLKRIVVEGNVGYFRALSRNEIRLLAEQSKKDEQIAMENYVKLMFVAGSKVVINNDYLLSALIMNFQSLLPNSPVKVEKI